MYIVYSTQNCMWCAKAIQLLRDKNQNYGVLYIDQDPVSLAEYREHFPGKKTVPQILHSSMAGTVTISGYEALVEYLK